MVNRLMACLAEEEPPAPEYFVVSGPFGALTVSRDEARAVLRQLRRWIRPRWIRVRDLSGSEIWIPSKLIGVVSESTAAQRAYDRELRRRVEREDNSGADWS